MSVAPVLDIVEASKPGNDLASREVKVFERTVWATLTNMVPPKAWANAIIVTPVGISSLVNTVCAALKHCCKESPIPAPVMS